MNTQLGWIDKVPQKWELAKIKKFFAERIEKVDDINFPPLSVTMSGVIEQMSNIAKTDHGDNRKLVKKNDFVINSRSDRKGSSGIAPRDGSVSVIYIVLQPNNINTQFVGYLLKSYFFKEEFFRNGKGIHWDLWSTKWSQLRNILIPIPPLKEQQEIAAFLGKKTSQIDTLVSNIEKKIELLKEYRIALINQYVTKGLNPKALNSFPTIALGKFMELYFGERITKSETLGSKYPVYGGGGKSFVTDKYNRKSEYIISRFAMSAKCVRYVKDKFWLLDSGASIRVKEGFQGDLSIQYIGLALISKQRDIIACARGAAQKNLDTKIFYKIKIPIPTLKEQKEIAKKLIAVENTSDKLIEKEKQRIKLLKEYRESLISNVVTGKVRITKDML